MWEEVIAQAASNGLWALMFCVLLVYQLKESRTREQKYQQTVRSLSQSMSVVNTISADLREIKEDLSKRFSCVKGGGRQKLSAADGRSVKKTAGLKTVAVNNDARGAGNAT